MKVKSAVQEASEEQGQVEGEKKKIPKAFFLRCRSRPHWDQRFPNISSKDVIFLMSFEIVQL